jgi:hypothetical protein
LTRKRDLGTPDRPVPRIPNYPPDHGFHDRRDLPLLRAERRRRQRGEQSENEPMTFEIHDGSSMK